MLTVEGLSKEVIKLGGSVVDYFVDNTGLTSDRIKELYNSNDSSDFRDIVYFIYKRKQLPSEAYELVCDFIQDSIREAHATIPHHEIPMNADNDVFDIVYDDCLDKLIKWATKEVRACDGNKLLKPKLIETNNEINKVIEDDEINLDEFDAKVIGDMVIAKTDDIVSYFIKKTGLTHDVIQDSFYHTEERTEYKRLYNIRNFEDSDGEMREVIQRWIRGVMNNIVFNSDDVPDEAKTELMDYLSNHANTKLNEWIEDEYSQCVETEPQIDENVNNIDIPVVDFTSQIEGKTSEEKDVLENDLNIEKKKEESLISKITSSITSKLVEKSVAPIKNIPFVYNDKDGKKVFINPKNVVLVEEIAEIEHSLIHLDIGKSIEIDCSFYTFMDNYSLFLSLKK